MTKRSTTEARQALSTTADEATAMQAGFEKALFDELDKALNCAAQSLAAIDEQEQLTLLGEAESAYQNALYLAEQTGTLRGSPITQKLHQLGAFLAKSDNLQEGN